MSRYLVALHVPEVRSFGADVAAVEPDGLERADIGGVDVLGVQLVVAALVFLEQGADIKAGFARPVGFGISVSNTVDMQV